MEQYILFLMKYMDTIYEKYKWGGPSRKDLFGGLGASPSEHPFDPEGPQPVRAQFANHWGIIKEL